MGLLWYTSLDEQDNEIIQSVGLIINYKMPLMFAWCRTYWYNKHKNNRIKLAIKDKEMIIGKLAIKIK